ncbi:competence protein ComK [Bacillus spongiae]|uniref:Competence protein ComK n=1 Tax=Bacillus spongiae TaxID=2683610 RepID=A0ABU8HIA5_9BACI
MEKVLSKYKINKNTMAIMATAHTDYQAMVIETNRTLFVKQTPLSIIKTACLYGGSSYEGRRSAVIYLTTTKQKVPIPINPFANIYAFPTLSPNHHQCNWIFLNHVEMVKDAHTSAPSNIQSIILFKQGQKLMMSESRAVLVKQMQRTALCLFYFTPQKV